MTIEELIKKPTVDPLKDIIPYFKLSKNIKLDSGSTVGCFNCGDDKNQSYLNTIPWTSVQYCSKCNHLNIINYPDRMAGDHLSNINCYG